jgi:pSer/pThr/pTyr-binding forkhead associated (FHA) protein
MSDTPARPDSQHLLFVEDNRGRHEVVLTEAKYSLGRAKNCDIRLYSQFVSRHHATLLRCLQEDGSISYRIVDGDDQGRASANGLLIEGRKVLSHDLRDGDQVFFSPNVFIIYRHIQPEPPTIPDPFDITLINPAMMEDGENSDVTS